MKRYPTHLGLHLGAAAMALTSMTTVAAQSLPPSSPAKQMPQPASPNEQRPSVDAKEMTRDGNILAIPTQQSLQAHERADIRQQRNEPASSNTGQGGRGADGSQASDGNSQGGAKPKDPYQDIEEQLAKGNITPEQAAKLRKTVEGVQRSILDQGERDVGEFVKDVKGAYDNDEGIQRIQNAGETFEKLGRGQSAGGKTFDPDKVDPSLTDKEVAEAYADGNEVNARIIGKAAKNVKPTIETATRGIEIYTKERDEYIQNNPNADAKDKRQSRDAVEKITQARQAIPGQIDRKAGELERSADYIKEHRDEIVEKVEAELAKKGGVREAIKDSMKNKAKAATPTDGPPPETEIALNEAEPPAEPGAASPPQQSASQAPPNATKPARKRGTIPPEDPFAGIPDPEQQPTKAKQTKLKPGGKAKVAYNNNNNSGPRGNAGRRAGVEAAITQQESLGNNPGPLADALNEINRPQGSAANVAQRAATGAAAAIIDLAILRKLVRPGRSGSGLIGGSGFGVGGSDPAISGNAASLATAGSKAAGGAGNNGNFLTVSPLDITPFNIEPVQFKPVQWKPIDFKPPKPLELPWPQFDTNSQYPGGANNLAFTYGNMAGRVATDLRPWREWLATQNVYYLEQLARAGGYPNLAAALADSRNLLRQSRNTGFRQWAWGPSVSSGAIGIWASEAQHNLARAQVLLGDLLQQSRAFESTGGLSDIGISGLDLAYILRDFGLEDGDTVDVTLEQFGRTIFSTRLSLLNAGTAFRQGLRPGVARLVIKAVNEGAISPNTAEIKVDNVVKGDGTQTYSLLTGETATLRIETNAVRGN